MKLIIKLLDRWRVLPGFQGGTDAVHLFHEAIGAILGNEVPNIHKHSRAFINITRLHVGCSKLNDSAAFYFTGQSASCLGQ